jgi:quercetin dioxygenase-like cupin family protein
MIDKLQSAMAQMPQAELLTEHFFLPGVYMRKVWRPAGTVIVGKVHKFPHIFMCAGGSIRAWTEKGVRALRAGDVVESLPGTKRVTYALEDSVGVTIHRTDKTDIGEIEEELIEREDQALFDATNVLKELL